MPDLGSEGAAAAAAQPQAQNEQGWIHLFVALGLIKRGEQGLFTISNEGEDLVIKATATDNEDISAALMSFQKAYQNFRQRTLASQLPHPLLVEQATAAAAAAEVKPPGDEFMKKLSGLDVIKHLFGEHARFGADGLYIHWDEVFEEGESASGRTISISKTPISNKLMRQTLEDTFGQMIAALSVVDVAKIYDCLAKKGVVLALDTAQPQCDDAQALSAELVERCFGFLPDGRAYFDPNFLMDICFCPASANKETAVTIPTNALLAYLNQNLLASTVIGDNAEGGMNMVHVPGAYACVARKVVVILADDTKSMEHDDKKAAYTAALKQLITEVQKVTKVTDEDGFYIKTFGCDKAKTTFAPQNLTPIKRDTDPKELVDELLTFQYAHTPLRQSVMEIFEHKDLKRFRDDPYVQLSVVLFTDGRENASTDESKDEFLKALQDSATRLKFQFFTVGVGAAHGTRFCKELAKSSFGRYVGATELDEVSSVVGHLAEITTLREIFEVVFNGSKSATSVHAEPVVVPLPGVKAGMKLTINGATYTIGERRPAAKAQAAASGLGSRAALLPAAGKQPTGGVDLASEGSRPRSHSC